MNNGQRPAMTPRKKMFLNDYRQAHPATDKPMDGAKYPAQMMWEQANNGKIMLKINDGIFKEGAQNKHKEVELDIYDRGDLFEGILEACNNKDFGTKQLQVAKHQFVYQGGSGRMSDKPVTQVLLTITRTEDGQITLGYSKGDYKAMVRFKGPRNTVLLMKGPTGERIEDHGTMSRWAARNWVNFHRPILDRMELDGWEPPKPRGEAANPARRDSGSNNQNTDFDSGDSFDDDF
jgi:hypothetical protein